MKNTILAGIFFLLLSPAFQEAISSASSNNENPKDDKIIPSFSSLTIEGQESQDEKVLLLLQNSQAVLEKAKIGEKERLLIYGEKPTAELESFHLSIRSTYDLLTQPGNFDSDEKREEFFKNTVRVKRGVLAFSAGLQNKPIPGPLPGAGYTEGEWNEGEQDLWKKIQILLEGNDGDYGLLKEDITAIQDQIIKSQGDNLKYIRFQFSKPSDSNSGSIKPDTGKLKKETDDLSSQAFELEGKIEEFEQKLEGSGNIIRGMANEFKSQVFWQKAHMNLTMGLHLAQQKGWGNWYRHCLGTGILDCAESIKTSQSNLQGLNAQLLLLMQAQQQN